MPSASNMALGKPSSPLSPRRAATCKDSKSNSIAKTTATTGDNNVVLHRGQQRRKKARTRRKRKLTCLQLGLGMGLVAYVTLLYQVFLVDRRDQNEPHWKMNRWVRQHRNHRFGRFGFMDASAGANENGNADADAHEPAANHTTTDDVPRLYAAPPTLRLPTPIINVGFPKAGTSSIFSFFHCNGLKAQHWLCCDPQNHPSRTVRNKLMSRCMLENLITHRPILEDCGDYDVYTEINGPRNFPDYSQRTLLEDGRLLSLKESRSVKLRIFFPQHHHLEEIHDQYPNATLILNQRSSAEAWIDSVTAWDIGLQYEILNEFYGQNSTRFLFGADPGTGRGRRVGATRPLSPFAANNVRDHLGRVHDHHLQYVRDWVKDRPSHALVEVDIEDDGAGTRLAEAFGLRDDCWGHYNKNENTGGGGGSRRRNQQQRNAGKGTQQKMAVSGQPPKAFEPLPATHLAGSGEPLDGTPDQTIQNLKQEKLARILQKMQLEQIEVNITQRLLEARAAEVAARAKEHPERDSEPT